MARILLKTGYEGIDVDQDFQAIADLVASTKSRFIYLTQGGAGRLFNVDNFSYVVETPVVESQPQTADNPDGSEHNVEGSLPQTHSTPNIVV